jgi:hypothetical protein
VAALLLGLRPAVYLEHPSNSVVVTLDPLEAAIGMRLQTLSVDNVGIPGASPLSYNLENLHVGLSWDCDQRPLTMPRSDTVRMGGPQLARSSTVR